MTNYLKTVDSEWFSQRLTGIMYCVVAAFAILVVRLFYLQVIEGQEYRRLSENNSIRLHSVDAPRGLIFDRQGKLLVENRPSFDLSIIPKDARPVDETLLKLAAYTEISLDSLTSKLASQKGRSSYRPILLKQDIGRNALAAIEVHKFDLPGIGIAINPRRHYIYRGSAAHLIGYMGEINTEELDCGDYVGCRVGDYIGKFGVERVHENLLRGRRGGRQVEVDVTGRVVRVLKTVDAEAGHNLYLTIDQRLQRKAEQLLADQSGAIVALDPESGGVLAMASSPSFDQNDFVTGMSHETWEALISNPDRPLSNKVVQAEYPPASTYKIITALAGLQEHVIDVSTTFYCPGYLTFGDRSFRCWRKGGHGEVDVLRALAESCDVFFYQVGLAVGVDKLARYATAGGLGKATGIGLNNESDGLVPTRAWKKGRTGVSWQGGETLPVAIGQGYNLVTPLQLAVLTAAIANGGRVLKPALVKEVRTAEGRVVQTEAIQLAGRLPVDPPILAIVQQGLWRAVNTPRGTAWGSRLKSVALAGKTGTAQVVGRKDDEEPDDEKIVPRRWKAHAWFVGYAPQRNPRIAVAVIVEHGEHGSTAAAPLASRLMGAYLGEDPHLEPVTAGSGD